MCHDIPSQKKREASGLFGDAQLNGEIPLRPDDSARNRCSCALVWTWSLPAEKRFAMREKAELYRDILEPRKTFTDD